MFRGVFPTIVRKCDKNTDNCNEKNGNFAVDLVFYYHFFICQVNLKKSVIVLNL